MYKRFYFCQYNFVFSSNTGKYGPKITAYLDIFDAVRGLLEKEWQNKSLKKFPKILIRAVLQNP